MSIFGERIRGPEPDIGTILSDYAKKDYVDAQDGANSEVLKQFKAQLVFDVAEYVKKTLYRCTGRHQQRGFKAI